MEIELIERDSTAIVEYSPIEQGLAELRQRLAGVVWDLTTTKGDKEARAARKEIVGLRSALESKRKEIKEPVIAHGKLIDAEAKRITAELLLIEEPIDAQIKADEARRETERKEKEAAERQRITTIHARIAAIRSIVPRAAAMRTAAQVQAEMDAWAQQSPGHDYEEFEGEATAAWEETGARLEVMLAQRQQEEAEQERIKAEQEAERQRLAAEREAIAKERAEQAERDRIAALARAEADAAAKAIRDAEYAEIQRQREELAAHAARMQAEREAMDAAKREAEQAKQKQESPAPVPAAEAFELTAEQPSWPPLAADLIEAIAEQFDVSMTIARDWLIERQGEIATYPGA